MFCEDVVGTRRKCLPTREDFRESRNNLFLFFPQCCSGAVVPNENINFVLFGTNTCMRQTCKVRTLLCKVKTEIDPAPCSSIEFGELCGLSLLSASLSSYSEGFLFRIVRFFSNPIKPAILNMTSSWIYTDQH